MWNNFYKTVTRAFDWWLAVCCCLLAFLVVYGVVTTDTEHSFEFELDHAMAQDMRVSSGAQDLRAKYINEFEKTRAHEKKARIEAGTWYCEGCGCTEAKGGYFNMHHVISVLEIFTKNLPDKLVYDKGNMVFVCRWCHFHICHDPDGEDGPMKPNWAQSNPNCRRDLARHLKRVKTLAP